MLYLLAIVEEDGKWMLGRVAVSKDADASW